MPTSIAHIGVYIVMVPLSIPLPSTSTTPSLSSIPNFVMSQQEEIRMILKEERYT
jgi:hypothetical protein